MSYCKESKEGWFYSFYSFYSFSPSTSQKTKASYIQETHPKNRLKDIPTQHSLTTQMIEIQQDGVTAQANTYFTGLHFGRGQWEGHHLTSWGQYVDTLQLVKGKWLITKRTCLFTAREGDERLMEDLV